MISLFISTPYFPATSFCSKNQKRSRLSQESSNEKSLELSYLTSDTCPLMCDNRFQTSLSSGPTPKDHLPLPHIIPHHFFFFFEWIISYWSHSEMNKKFYCSLCTAWNPLSSAEYLRTKGSFTQGHRQQSQRKVELMGEIFNFVLEKCSLQSAPLCFIFLFCAQPPPLPPSHICLSAGKRQTVENVFSVYSPVLCAAPGFIDTI